MKREKKQKKDKSLNVFAKNFVYYYPITSLRCWRNVGLFLNRFKYAYQRAVYGYCDADIWGLDFYLANHLRNTLNELAGTTHGYPMDFTEESWGKELQHIAKLFDNYSKSEDWENPYSECLHYHFGDSKLEVEADNEDNVRKWRMADQLHEAQVEAELNEAFTHLRKVFRSLWD